MSVIGIVSEFNPFHNGHKYLIDRVKGENDIVVCVMSGNYVQRGEPAIFPKDIRLKAALMNGVDIVLELPFLYATASAEKFASASVQILNSFGCDKIAFGTENTNESTLNNAVDILLSDGFDEKIGKYLAEGVSYPAARQRAFDEYDCECDISSPNNILAIEYVSAIKKNNYNIDVITIDRIGAGYNYDGAIDEFASATHIRNLIKDGNDFSKYVPDNAYLLYKTAIESGDYLDYNKYNLVTLSILRANGANSSIANMAEGLENRINSAIKRSVTLDEIYDKAKSKRFTHSRIRRAVLSSTFDVKKEYAEKFSPYVRLLGFNQSKAYILGELVKKCELPFVTSYSDIEYSGSVSRNLIFDLEEKSTDLFNLSLHNPKPCSTERTFSIIKMK